MFERYKELWFGLAIGLSMWALDAMMHTSLEGHHGLNGFFVELISAAPTQLFFRSLFVIVSMAFGHALWRSNRRRSEMESLQTAVTALHRQISNPLLLIEHYSKMLSLKEGWPVDREAVEIAAEIKSNAEKINQIINQLPPPGSPLAPSDLSQPASEKLP